MCWRCTPHSPSTNSAARQTDRSRPRGEDVGYRAFLRAFNLQDLVDLHPVPPSSYSCFHREGSRIDTMACHSNSLLMVASSHYWSTTLFPDHHLPLPVAQEEKPHPDATSRTPEHHLLQVALSPEEEAEYKRAVAARRST